MSKKKPQAPKEVKPVTENKAVEPAKTETKSIIVDQNTAEILYPFTKEFKDLNNPERPATSQDDAAERNDSIQAHSAQVTEGDAAQARSEGVDLNEQPLDPRDGAQLDAANGEPEFDVKKEKELAHAKPEEQPDNIKHAIVNPNGVGNEWPR